MLKHYMQLVRGGGLLNFDQAMELATTENPQELFLAADQLRRAFHNDNLDLCSIVNAKSGKCSEDCKFCAQSSWYDVAIESYETVDEETALKMARENEAQGVQRFSLVTAGRTVSDNHLDFFGEIYQQLRAQTKMSFCASMGMLTREKAEKLKSFGVTRYHCNLEACRSYFPKVCTTHTWEEKIASIRIAQEVGLEVCSGGIIGMGESLRHRLELAFELRELGILSIPMNILTPIPNTPFADLEPISVSDILTCVAMFRIINPQAIIRLAGGRGMLGEEQSRCFTSGANGAIVGNYLTTAGNNLQQDIDMFRHLGFDISQPEEDL
ncbi:biotin synthase BioB [Desulfopila aestuarii]|uniref:Biotin synthase n=1 Tax=Desulfopila aestuarii DSM 18488 TaxID=1121416 RepID=A0A1M7Y1B9_9BACT|nr:biotin synthase BioB [Desulfopila aestuarii]SHO45550.1 biotin synthase [Desulfopila aestuarii DSM 18488]